MPIFKKEGNQLVEYTQPSQITESLKPLGNTLFADLPATPSQGDMYKVTDDFTTDNRFEEPNKEVKAPIFIYFNGTKWVLFASSGGDTHIIGTRNQCISWARQGMIPDGSVCIFTDDYATSTPYVVGTQAQINAMLSQGLLGDGTVCVITDDYSADVNLAENVGYDNTTSGLSADNMQEVADELKENILQLNSDLSETNSKLVLPNSIKSLELPLIPGYIVFDQVLADNTRYRVAFDIANKTILLQFINDDGTLTNIATWQGV